MMNKYLIMFFAMTLLSGCEKTEFEVEQEKYIDALEWVLGADPDKDFERAIENEDFRFIGTYGINNPIPGLMRSCVNVKTDVRYLKGTSEILLGYEHEKLNTIAGLYASHYNLRMRIYLADTQGFKCES
ncbi:MAG: hypothetical protein H6999_10210 [Hahellaceae bacterium]|nr:hypothetical protein [Hahellaceae bacterium]MCP5170115.1 hypothetical protein [Hahellaceae bacterium]